jgi:endonuclease/exonuclease/phosphatase (EEP) superfamily protein YafD
VIGWRKWLRLTVLALSALYPLGLLVTVLLLRAYGESWWMARLTLYFPRMVFALPLPILVAALLVLRARRWLATQVAALLLVLFPLMGLVLPWPHRPDRAAPSLRVLSYNVNSGFWGWDKIMGQIDAYHPDVVMLQEVVGDGGPGKAMLEQRYPHVLSSTQFLIASRYPISDSRDLERVVGLDGRPRSPRAMAHVIETPLGPIAFYNIHPISPRSGLWALRRGGLRRGLVTGSLLRGETARLLQSDGHLRDTQIETVARHASTQKIPVVIGGDTNLPDLSPALRFLAPFRDGFRDAGAGFGYTYPVGRLTWMRLDRLFTSRDLRFVSFEVGRHVWASDHLCVVADLQKRTP